jgi:hypothetical protein
MGYRVKLDEALSRTLASTLESVAYEVKTVVGQDILVLQPERGSLKDFRALLEWVIGAHPLENLSQCVAIATPGRLRVRRPAK